MSEPIAGSRGSLDEAGPAADGESAVPHPVALVARPGLLLVADALPALAALGLDDFDGLARCDAGSRIKRSWLREVRRVPLADAATAGVNGALPGPNGATTAVFIKRYQAPAWWRMWNRGLWQERRGGLREWRNLWLLRRLGIATLEPLAYAEGDLDGARMTVLVTRELTHVLDLEVELTGALGIPRDAAARARRRRIAARLAELVRRLHACGLYHRDLYLGHVRIEADGDRLYLIDVQRMGPARWAERGRVKELAQLAYTAYAPFVTRIDRLRFLIRGYLRVAGPARHDPRVRRVVQMVDERIRKMRLHQARKRVRRVARERSPVGVYFDRHACRLEWCLDPQSPPTLLQPGGEPLVVRPVAVPARLVADGLDLELPEPLATTAPALDAVAWRDASGRIRRLTLGAQPGCDARAIWQAARATTALAF